MTDETTDQDRASHAAASQSLRDAYDGGARDAAASTAPNVPTRNVQIPDSIGGDRMPIIIAFVVILVFVWLDNTGRLGALITLFQNAGQNIANAVNPVSVTAPAAGNPVATPPGSTVGVDVPPGTTVPSAPPIGTYNPPGSGLPTFVPVLPPLGIAPYQPTTVRPIGPSGVTK